MKQPVATVTNLAYFVTALCLFSYDTYTAPIIAGLGVASMGYHYFETRIWQTWDVKFMYATFVAIIAHHAHNLTGDLLAPVIFAVLLTGWMWLQSEEYDSTYSIAILFSVGALLAYLVSGSLLFVPVFAVAYVLNMPYLGRFPWRVPGWLVDVTHGAWHILTAIAIYMMH